MTEFFDKAWIAWAAITLASFVALEIFALKTDGGKNTLTQSIREWTGVKPHRPWRVAGVAIVVAFCVWFPLHLFVPSFPL